RPAVLGCGHDRFGRLRKPAGKASDIAGFPPECRRCPAVTRGSAGKPSLGLLVLIATSWRIGAGYREEQDMSIDVLVIGAGKIGSMVAELLASSGSYRVTLADRAPPALPHS